MNAPLVTTRFRVDGIDCGSCAAKIDTAVRRLPGIDDVAVSATTGTLTVRHPAEGDLAGIEPTVVALGYRITRLDTPPPVAPAPTACGCGHGCSAPPPLALEPAPAAIPTYHHAHDHAADGRPWWTTAEARLALAAGVALAAAAVVSALVPDLGALPWLLPLVVGLAPILRRAVQAARFGSPFTIETLMSIAAIGATAIGATEEAATVVFLFLVGELLEGLAAGRARDGIRALAALVPKTARLKSADGIREVAADTLVPGDVVLVRPGDSLPADGIVVAGGGRVDESPVTGESLGVHKHPGDPVYAGTIAGDAALDVRVTAFARDNTIARIVRLVEEAQEAKAPTERLIDRFARWYTPAVMAIAAVIAVGPPLVLAADWHTWIYRGLAILLIGCPCALVISVPAAIASGLAAGARRGLLIKGGGALETLARATVVCFDKTGTLTAGRPRVGRIETVAGTPERLLALAAAVETGSSHPIAVAVLEKAAADGLALPAATAVRTLPGRGVAATVDGAAVLVASPAALAERRPLDPSVAALVDARLADGDTVALVAVDDTILGVIAVRDEPRPDARAGLAALTRAGLRTLVLTGDHHRVAEAIGRDLAVAVRAELLPADKLAAVAALRAEGEVVVKVGDGINDAPALAAADVGIAVGGGTDVALETADAAVLDARVGGVPAMIALARRTLATVRANIALALALKALFLVTTVLGVTGLWPAILADTGATVLVTLNALRLLAWRPSPLPVA